MEVRPAVPADAAGIARVSARSTRAAYEPLVEDESILEAVEAPAFPARLREWLAEIRGDDGGVVYLVAVERERESGADARSENREDEDSESGVNAEGWDGREILGFAQCYDAAKHRPADVEAGAAYLKSLYADPDRWGEGIGTRLLEAVVAGIEASVLVLDVLRNNDDARAFYEARGFEYAADTTVELGGAVYETARYRRELRG